MADSRNMPNDHTRCRSFAPGHQLHWIQCRLSHRQDWAWNDAIVVRAHGHVLELMDLMTDEVQQFWNHRLLDDLLTPGAPVAWHDLGFLIGPDNVQLCIKPLRRGEPLPQPCGVELPPAS